MLDHIVPYLESNVLADQPWLTPAESEQAKAMATEFAPRDMEPWQREHLLVNADEGDQAAIAALNPLCHFILTTDFRIVQEPNLLRWGIFLEKGKHRVIEQTTISKGIGHRDYEGVPFKRQSLRVSTVFIGSHEGELFETMVFGGLLSDTHWRNATLLDAKKCHWKAVTIARRLDNYVRRHCRSVHKDWVRLAKFWKLAEKRGENWCQKQIPVMEGVYNRLKSLPGQPDGPQPQTLYSLLSMFQARPTLVEDPLI